MSGSSIAGEGRDKCEHSCDMDDCGQSSAALGGVLISPFQPERHYCLSPAFLSSPPLMAGPQPSQQGSCVLPPRRHPDMPCIFDQRGNHIGGFNSPFLASWRPRPPVQLPVSHLYVYGVLGLHLPVELLLHFMYIS